MKKIHLLSIILLASLSGRQVMAQNSASNQSAYITVEEMISEKRQFLQLMVNKVFIEKKGIGFLSLSSYAAFYKANAGTNEFQNTSLIYQNLYKGIGLNSGATFTSAEGLNNFIGLQYMYHNPSLSLIYLPTYQFTTGNKLSQLALAEFTPSINDRWSGYSRLQLHYNHDLDKGRHFRSYAYSRLGVTYKYISFGLAHNVDRYTSAKTTSHNAGIFIKLTF